MSVKGDALTTLGEGVKQKASTALGIVREYNKVVLALSYMCG